MTRAPLSVMDVLFAALAGLAGAALAAGPLLVAPSFAVMYAELGGELPWPTRLALAPWPGLVLGAIVLVLVGVGLRRADVVRRRLALAGGALVACAALLALWWALYLPLYRITGAIAPE